MVKSHSNEVSAISRADVVADGTSPYRALGEMLLWLLVIVAPAVPILALTAAVAPYVQSPNHPLEAAPWLVGVLPVMICLVTTWAVLSHERLLTSLGRGAAQLGGLYFAALLLLLLDSKLWSMPVAAAIGFVLFALPPVIVSAVLRWYRWRLVRCWRHGQLIAPLAHTFQFRLVDVFAWTTLIAVFLGIGTLLLAQFNREPSGWEGLAVVAIVLISAWVCLPMGVLYVVFTWLVLAEKRRMARGIVAMCIALAYAGLAVYVLANYRFDPSLPNEEAYFLVTTPVALAAPALVFLGVARLVGWRMVRLPARKTESAKLT